MRLGSIRKTVKVATTNAAVERQALPASPRTIFVPSRLGHARFRSKLATRGLTSLRVVDVNINSLIHGLLGSTLHVAQTSLSCRPIDAGTTESAPLGKKKRARSFEDRALFSTQANDLMSSSWLLDSIASSQ